MRHNSIDRKGYSRIDTAVVLGVVRDLSPLAPNNLSSSGNKPQLRHIDLDDRPSS